MRALDRVHELGVLHGDTERAGRSTSWWTTRRVPFGSMTLAWLSVGGQGADERRAAAFSGVDWSVNAHGPTQIEPASLFGFIFSPPARVAGRGVQTTGTEDPLAQLPRHHQPGPRQYGCLRSRWLASGQPRSRPFRTRHASRLAPCDSTAGGGTQQNCNLPIRSGTRSSSTAWPGQSTRRGREALCAHVYARREKRRKSRRESGDKATHSDDQRVLTQHKERNLPHDYRQLLPRSR